MNPRTIGYATLLSLMITAVSLAQVPTWTYDPDNPVPPDTGEFPNSPGQPFDFQAGANAFRSIVEIGVDDKALQVDTSGTGSNSVYWQIDGGAGTNWDVDITNGYSVEWKLKLDGTTLTEDGAAQTVAGFGPNRGIIRVRDAFGRLQVLLQDATGNPGQISHDVPNPADFHTYRLDVQGTEAKIFLDDYPYPVLTKTLDGAADFNGIWFGDGTGDNNGKYQTDYLRSFQSAALGIQNAPSATDNANTLFLAHYDGTTGNAGLDADFAVGSTAATSTAGTISATSKFGAGSLDPAATTEYETAGNFNLEAGTIEMWIQTDNWADGSFRGFFDIFGANGDIRIQKTSGNALQVYMSNRAGTSWSITVPNPALDSNWHHLAWSWDFSANVSHVHIDGVAQPAGPSLSNLTTIGFTGALDPNFEVGSIQSGSVPFHGLIDEVRISQVDLYGGQDFTPQSSPYDTPPPATAACCLPDETCIDTSFTDCADQAGTWQGLGTDCNSVSCVIPVGACCLPDGSCSELTEEECTAQLGLYHGDGITCGAVVCDQPGACCLPGGQCEETTEPACTAQNGIFQGEGTSCDVTNCPPPAPSWIYDPDDGNFPNDSGEPFEPPGIQGGTAAFRSLVDLGSGDNVLAIDTSPTGVSNSVYWQLVGPADNWNVSSVAGVSVDWTVRLDEVELTWPSAANLAAGHPQGIGIMRLFNSGGPLTIGLQSVDGNSGEVHHVVPDPAQFHTYRLDVKGNLAQVYLDDYPFPVLSKVLPPSTTNHRVTMGDGTGTNNGKYQIDLVRSFQAGAIGTANAPDPFDPANTLFLAHYNGDTGQGGLDADFAAGNPAAIADGAAISATAQFGAGSLDQRVPTTSITYETANNFNLTAGTIEMWIKAETAAIWGDANYYGFFDIFGPDSDIRIQKTGNTQSLQAVMSDRAGTSWSITTGDLSAELGDTEWHHIAWTWDFAANVSALYVDGQVKTTAISLSGLPTIGFTGVLAPTFEVGTIQGSNNNWDGLIDELRISDRDLYGRTTYTLQTAEFGSPIGPETGACCARNGDCSEVNFSDCSASGGQWQGVGSTCAQVACIPFRDPYADRDFDGDVDQADFAELQKCITGPAGGVPPGCEDFDRPEPGFPTGDGDIDQDDVAAFQLCASGPTVMADPSCDD